MNIIEFFRRWFVGTKQYANSQLGLVEAQFYISIFISLGLIIGCVQRKMAGDSVLAYIFFAFFLFQLIGTKQLFTAYRLLLNQWRILKKIEKGGLR